MKIKLDKIKFKSPKSHSLGKKKTNIKLNGRGNKFIVNQILKNNSHNTSNMNSARSKGNKGSESKETKKSIKVDKNDYVLKAEDGKLRFSMKAKNMLNKPNCLKKNPLKILKKISPERKNIAEAMAFHIPMERVSKYNACKLSGRTKLSSDSLSNMLIRKNSNVSRKVDNSNTRGNKAHLIFRSTHQGKVPGSKLK